MGAPVFQHRPPLLLINILSILNVPVLRGFVKSAFPFDTLSDIVLLSAL